MDDKLTLEGELNSLKIAFMREAFSQLKCELSSVSDDELLAAVDHATQSTGGLILNLLLARQFVEFMNER